MKSTKQSNSKKLRSIRLTEEEKEKVVRAFQGVLGGNTSFQVWVFGSRIDPKKKGGDLDLLLELEEPVENETLLKRKLLIKLKDLLGDQKIDLLMTAPNLSKSTIHEIAKKEGNLLWKSNQMKK